MHLEADAEVCLAQGEDASPSPVESFGFICTFGDQSFSAAVVPDGTGRLVAGRPETVRLRFLVPSASVTLSPGAAFTFFEQGRVGDGRLLTHAL